jgi:hypothetical protein
MRSNDLDAVFSSLESTDGWIFRNKNTAGENVVTLFLGGRDFYKIDILFREDLGVYHTFFVKGMESSLNVIDPFELLYHRICKIAEADIRGYGPDKVISHQFAIVTLCRKLTARAMPEILNFDRDKLRKSVDVLLRILPEDQVCEYRVAVNRIMPTF